MPDEDFSGEDGPKRYSVRLSPRSLRDRTEVAAWIMEIVGEEVARDWVGGLDQAVASLSEYPKRNAVRERESRLIGREVRRLLYRRTVGSAAYHAFYLIEETGDDGARVVVFHIRHASRKPLSGKEARDLQVGR